MKLNSTPKYVAAGDRTQNILASRHDLHVYNQTVMPGLSVFKLRGHNA